MPRWAWVVLALLFAMHRWTRPTSGCWPSVLPRVEAELRLEETQAGWLATMLLIGSTVAGPPIGYLADRLRRPRLLALGFALWSLAAVATGLARTYDQLQAARALAGAGGAASMVIALTLLIDLFPRRMRGRVLAGFFLAMPAGAALGRFVAAVLPANAGWQAAFLAAGAPGLALALLALLVPEPVRGASEASMIPGSGTTSTSGPAMKITSISWSIPRTITRSSAWRSRRSRSPGWSTGCPRSSRPRGWTRAQAGGPRPLTLLAAAVVGIGAGGWLADAFAATRPRRLFLLPGLAMFGSIGCVLVAIYGRSPGRHRSGLFLAVGAMFLEIRAVLYDPRRRGDAQHARRRLRRRAGRRPRPG